MDWNQFDKGIFIVNVLGIIYNTETKKVLIGKRENDPFIKKLSWCFPGGRPAYGEGLEHYLKLEINKKTGLEVGIKKVVFAKTYPEDRKFLSIYYYCETKDEKAIAGGSFVEVKWVNPTKVTEYFTTSLHNKVLEFLKTLK